MSAEFYISFKDPSWYLRNIAIIKEQICTLQTVVSSKDDEFWLLGKEARNSDNRWSFDVRLFTIHNKKILIEISAHPESIESDLSSFLTWIRNQTEILVLDEDGELSGW